MRASLRAFRGLFLWEISTIMLVPLDADVPIRMHLIQLMVSSATGCGHFLRHPLGIVLLYWLDPTQ